MLNIRYIYDIKIEHKKNLYNKWNSYIIYIKYTILPH